MTIYEFTIELLPGHVHVAELTMENARYLLEGREEVYVGRGGEPGIGTRLPTDEALALIPADAAFEAMYFEV
jgi:hypothetical protein